ncbi:MAG: YicC/YloC family endoribonuclease [Gemmatimonadaceae bacterium]
MIYSMTGFGSADGMVGVSALSVEVRTVNHRFFNPSIKLPANFARWDTEVRELLKQNIARGHVSLSARVEPLGSSRTPIDEERFGEYVTMIRGLQERHGLHGSLDAATILSLPDVISSRVEAAEQTSPAELLAIVGEAVARLRLMRAEEGARLAVFLNERVTFVEGAVARIAERAPHRLVEQHARINKSVHDLIGETGVDPQRLAQEIAIMADRLDISEEIERFESHIDSFRRTLQANGDEPVGKRLGFLLQEMVREANTIGSKANDSAILGDVVLVKEELERIREQVENIE